MPPKSSFITVEALEHAAVEIGKTKEAVRQLADPIVVITGAAVSLLLFGHFLAGIRLLPIYFMCDVAPSQDAFESAIGSVVGRLRSVRRTP